MNLTFFIIYTPESFSKLKIAIDSLLHFTNYKYILVGNGLSESEYSAISSYCNTNNNLSCLDLPGNITIPHGTALTHLFNISNLDFFCFLDSDIVAFEDFSNELEKLILTNDIVSSCKPIEWLMKNSPKGYRGHCTVSPSGKNVAITYFAVYKREKVVSILQKYNISFERYMRKSQVPIEVQELLSLQDQYTWKFNTAKLLNILQAYAGQRFAYQEFQGLIHLGGVSRYSEHTKQGTRNKIDPENYQAFDRVHSRYFFHQLLTNIKNNSFIIPEINLYDHVFQQSLLNVSNRLIKLKQELDQYAVMETL